MEESSATSTWKLRPAAFIENVRFGYKLNADYAQAACRAQVMVSSLDGNFRKRSNSCCCGPGRRWRGRRKTLPFASGSSEVEVEFHVNAPALVVARGTEPLSVARAPRKRSRRGCLELAAPGSVKSSPRGRTFLLNGQRLVLKGVARHDMWKEQGFTLTRRQMEQDMRMIKAMGANFIRQVHYPHHRYLTDLADEYGLLISEEPGYWNMDFQTMPRTMIELGYRIMERVIRRDWNSPSVFAWLLSNECTLTAATLREGKEICNRLDPIGRLVSAANSMPKAKGQAHLRTVGDGLLRSASLHVRR